MGDFQAHFQRPDTGINTVEGNVAGSRAAGLSKKRAAEQAEFEARKQKIKLDSERGKLGIDAKFDTNQNVSTEEQKFRAATVGLVTAEEFRKANAEVEKARGQKGDIFGEEPGEDEGGGEGEVLTEEERKKLEKQRKKTRKKALKEKKKRMAALSFAGDEELDDGDADESAADAKSQSAEDNGRKKAIMKNPEVDTSFLPDQDREERARAERERLRKEWLDRQKSMKEEVLEITYSYWDGTGHRRTVHCKKGDTVAQFLELVRRDLAKEFQEMRNVSSDALLYVKEDLIIPQDISFYDLIATRARGKSGPLFNFDVHEDVRIGAVDSRVEKDESHPGKIVERRWFDRNKHIFPASRWEIYDPAKEYGTYTIHGGEVFDGSEITDAVVVSNSYWSALASKLPQLLLAQLIASIAFVAIASFAAAQGKFLIDVASDATNNDKRDKRNKSTFRRLDEPPQPPLDFAKLFLCVCIDILGSANEAIPLVGELVDVVYAPIAALLLRQLFAGSNIVFLLEFTEEILPFTDILPLATICHFLAWKTSSQHRKPNANVGLNDLAATQYSRQLNPYKGSAKTSLRGSNGSKDNSVTRRPSASDDDLGIANGELDLGESDDDLGLDDILSSITGLKDGKDEDAKTPSYKPASKKSEVNTNGDSAKSNDTTQPPSSSGGTEAASSIGESAIFEEKKDLLKEILDANPLDRPQISEVDFGKDFRAHRRLTPPVNNTSSADEISLVSDGEDTLDNTLWTDGDATRQHKLMLKEDDQAPAFSSGFEDNNARLESMPLTGPSLPTGTKGGSGGNSLVDSLLEDVATINGDNSETESKKPPPQASNTLKTPLRGGRFSSARYQRTKLHDGPQSSRSPASDENGSEKPLVIQKKEDDTTLSTVTDPSESPFIYTYKKDDDSMSHGSSVDLKSNVSRLGMGGKGFAENNWMVRFLTNELSGELSEDNLTVAKEVLRQKCLVGLLEEKGESFERMLNYFGWQPKNDDELECLEKKLEYAWSMKHKHPKVESGTRALIEEANQLDLRLYEYAKDLFTEQAELFPR
ncbi:hypothetical protein ACHAXT_007137 [Thalassiosira profunda]